MSARAIRVRGLSKLYPGEGGHGPVQALDDVSFDIADGERVGVIGANGAGKSTLLQIIAGVNAPTSGTCEVDGHVNAILTVGIGVREDATGRENLYLEGAVQGKTRAEIDARIADMIAFADLGDFIDRPLRTYSTGMKARLAFAALVFIDPEILIVDEALGVGDARFSVKATTKMRELCARGGIVLFVSHSLGAIRELCPRTLWFDRGRLRMDGPTEQVTTAYREEIHAREEAEIARKFGQAGAPWSVRPERRVDSVELWAAGAGAVVVECGSHAELRVRLTLAGLAGAERLRVWVERNDGVMLLDESCALPQVGPCELAVPLGVIDWRPFLYQAHVEIVEQGVTTAHGAVAFKVWSDEVVRGGSPILRTPPRIVSRRLG